MPAHPPVQGHDGELIRNARLAMVPAMSIPQAAALTGDSPGNWGHVERGYQSSGRSKGRRVIMHPPAPILARMASVTGVTPAELIELSRRHAGTECHAGEAAEILRAILDERRQEAEAVSVAIAGADDAFLRALRAAPGISEERRAEYARMWHRGGREKVAAVVARLLRQVSGED